MKLEKYYPHTIDYTIKKWFILFPFPTCAPSLLDCLLPPRAGARHPTVSRQHDGWSPALAWAMPAGPWRDACLHPWLTPIALPAAGCVPGWRTTPPLICSPCTMRSLERKTSITSRNRSTSAPAPLASTSPCHCTSFPSVDLLYGFPNGTLNI
jgi:hypothetical protein